MADGTTKVIERIRSGDLVATRNPETGKMEAKHVVQTSVKRSTNLVTIHLREAQSGNLIDAVTCTPQHPFFADGEGFTAAGDLAIGTSIVTRAGPDLIVAAVDRGAAAVPVYNFTVQDDHTYFVETAQRRRVGA